MRRVATADLLAYYTQGVEIGRLAQGSGPIEAARTQELLGRYLPEHSAILDVGGGPGFYADWLARLGHQVRLLDPVPLHVQEARRVAGDPPRFEADLGDARDLPAADGSFDVVLVMGPLYHLVDEEDRVTVLREARRVCRDGGRVVATAISHFAPALDGARAGWIADDGAFAFVREQLKSGRGQIGGGAVTAPTFFHSAERLTREAETAGLVVDAVMGIEGPGWLVPDFAAKWGDPVMRDRLMWLARTVESDPRMREASDHLFLVARRAAS
jgi:SAM-dependent methyltransferase